MAEQICKHLKRSAGVSTILPNPTIRAPYLYNGEHANLTKFRRYPSPTNTASVGDKDHIHLQ